MSRLCTPCTTPVVEPPAVAGPPNSPAWRYQHLSAEIEALDAQLARLVASVAPGGTTIPQAAAELAVRAYEARHYDLVNMKVAEGLAGGEEKESDHD